MSKIIETLATKDDLATFKYQLSRDIRQVRVDTIKWMFIFGISQVGAALVIAMLIVKK